MSTEIREPDEHSTIEEHFQHYLQKSFSRRQLGVMSGTQMNEMRKCFFGGMSSVLVVGNDPQVRKNLQGQCLTFWRKEMSKYQSDNN